jgi:hypothetical protein
VEAAGCAVKPVQDDALNRSVDSAAGKRGARLARIRHRRSGVDRSHAELDRDEYHPGQE